MARNAGVVYGGKISKRIFATRFMRVCIVVHSSCRSVFREFRVDLGFIKFA